jgi:hypothetical protein
MHACVLHHLQAARDFGFEREVDETRAHESADEQLVINDEEFRFGYEIH